MLTPEPVDLFVIYICISEDLKALPYQLVNCHRLPKRKKH